MTHIADWILMNSCFLSTFMYYKVIVMVFIDMCILVWLIIGHWKYKFSLAYSLVALVDFDTL